jgi:hypothetical protein
MKHTSTKQRTVRNGNEISAMLDGVCFVCPPLRLVRDDIGSFLMLGVSSRAVSFRKGVPCAALFWRSKGDYRGRGVYM